MIIGLVGPVQQDIESVIEYLTLDKSIQVVDGIQLLRLADRKTLNSLTIQDYHKKYFLKKLEKEFGIVIVTGNIILSDEILPWIMKENGTIVVVSRDKMESYDKDTLKSTAVYWDETSIQRYNLEVRFRKLYEKLDKFSEDNLYYVDISDENSEELNTLIGASENWSESNRSNCGFEELLNITTVGKDNDTMTMEESIKKAMKELGMDVDETEEVAPKKQDTKPQKPKKEPVKSKKEIKPEPFMNPPESEENEEETSEDENNSVFVKITGDSMALLIPVGLELEQQTIGGMEFNVATVEVPDIKNHKLQELEIKVGTSQKQTEKKSEKPKRVPITTEKSITKTPVKTVVVSGDMKDLQDEKARLDAEIKKYRQLGNIDTVNSLRKQRRAVRNKVNSLK